MSPKTSGRKRNESPAAKAAGRPAVAVQPKPAASEPAKKSSEKDSSGCFMHSWSFMAAFICCVCFLTVAWEERGLTIILGKNFHLLTFRSVFETWSKEREFLLFDLCALSLSAMCLYHAWRKTKNFVLYLSIFFGGALIDLTIRKIPQLASFWQAQNWMEMLNYSEPCYILFGMYFVFQYPAVQLAQNMRLGCLGEAAAAALLATAIYHPYDIVGAKYVWWMWHRDDPIMVAAEVGVPVASTFWTMAYTGALAATLSWAASSARLEKYSAAWTAAVVAPVASLGLMNLPFTFFYQPLVLGLGVPEIKVLHGFRAVCLVAVAHGLWRRTAQRKVARENIWLLVVPLITFAALALVVANFNPADVQRHGLWLTYGDCKTQETAYFGGFERSKFNCNETSGRNAELWDFKCLKTLPKIGAEWYTVCPKAFPAGWHAVFGKHLAAGVGSVLAAYFLAAQ